MSADGEFLELVRGLCQRPSMYVPGGSLVRIIAYLAGYMDGAKDCPLGGERWDAFNAWVNDQLGFPDNLHWMASLEMAATSDREGLERLQQLVEGFVEALRTQTPAEIEARSHRAEPERPPASSEPTPESALRAFLAASLRGRREEIEPLVVAHEDAHLLWQGPYPEDAAEALAELWEGARIGRVASASSEDHVQLVCSAFPGPLTVMRVDGRWRVDAAPVIEARRGRSWLAEVRTSPLDS